MTTENIQEALEIATLPALEDVVHLMDDDLREELHADMAPCEPEEFLLAYMDAHLEKFGIEFAW